MRIILVLAVFFSCNVFACKEAIIVAPTLNYFPSPKFQSDLVVTSDEAEVTVIISTDISGKVIKSKIIKVIPSILPLELIDISLKRAVFSHSVSDYEVTFNFDIYVPNKIVPILDL